MLKRAALHHATLRDPIQIKWVNEQMTQQELNKLLLIQDNNRQTAWHFSADWSVVEALGKLWEWAKDVLNKDELKHSFC